MKQVQNMQDERKEPGVVIPQQVIADSNARKAARKKTLPELPVYRAGVSLKAVIVTMMSRGPRRLSKFFDEMLVNSSELSKSIGLADTSRNSGDRVWYINCAMTLAYELRNDIAILRRLGVIGRDDENKTGKMVAGIIAQLVAWRDYTNSRGA